MLRKAAQMEKRSTFKAPSEELAFQPEIAEGCPICAQLAPQADGKWLEAKLPLSSCKTCIVMTWATALVTLKLFAAVTTDRKSTRLNSSHLVISYAVFC